MFATKLKGRVTANRQLILTMPEEIAPGVVEVIVLHNRPNRTLRRKAKGRAAHPAFGLWADRKDITDSASYAALLRQQLQSRSDGRA